MDGMLFLVYFFPLIVAGSFIISFITFILTLWIGFSEDIQASIQNYLVDNVNPFTTTYLSFKLYDKNRGYIHDGLFNYMIALAGNPPFQNTLYFYPLLVSISTILTVTLIYHYGGILRHGNAGWKFLQFGRGGIRFVILQIVTWTTLAFSVILPWTDVDDLGWFPMFGLTEPASKDKHAHAGLVVAGAALGMLSNTTNILGLMSFDSSETRERMRLRRLETGKWKWNIFGNGKSWWWMFMGLQWALVLFSFALAYVSESKLRNNLVQAIVLMVFTTALAYAVSITNLIGGKWMHGEKVFRSFMPLEGGAVFALLQALGWMSFAFALALTLSKLLSLVFGETAASGVLSNVSITFAGSLGIVSYLLIFTSILFFDPAATSPTRYESDSTDESDVADDESVSENEEEEIKANELTQPLRSRSAEKARGPAIKPRRERSREPAARAKKHEDANNSITSDGSSVEDNVNSYPVAVLGRRRNPQNPNEVEYLVQHRPGRGVEMVLKWMRLNSKKTTKNIQLAIKKWEYEKTGITSPRPTISLSNNLPNSSVLPKGIATQNISNNFKQGINGNSYDRNDESKNVDSSPIVTITDEWEEFEDEEGNVFYVNVRTGRSAQTLPE